VCWLQLLQGEDVLLHCSQLSLLDIGDSGLPPGPKPSKDFIVRLRRISDSVPSLRIHRRRRRRREVQS